MSLRTLGGVRVLDFSSYLAGPYAAALLGDLGADVIKIESPEGDAMRSYPSTLATESRAFIGANRNKRGIVIDLKLPAGVAVSHRLVADCDVVLHNFRPGVAERLKLDFGTLRVVNPRLVYAHLTGYGPDGPIASRPGFDQVLQCMTGIAMAQGHPGPEPKVVWGSAVDYYSASLLAMAVAAALFDRERTGAAQLIDASLLRSALAMQAGRLVWAEGEPRDIERDLHGGPISGIHPTKDGYIYVQGMTPSFWKALCDATGFPSYGTDPRFRDRHARREVEAEFLPLLRGALAARTSAEWEAIFGTDVPSTTVRPLEDMFDHPQVLAQALVRTHEHPTLGRYRAIAGPVTITSGEDSTEPDRRAPVLGEHTNELLGQFGLSDQEIRALRAAGAIR